MKILIVSQYFWPENFRINDLALELKQRGHSITVLTGIPNYPDGEFYKDYGIFKKVREEYHGISVIRVPIFSRGRSKGLRLALNYFSFALFASLLGPFYCKGKYEAIFVFEPSPITVCLPAIVLRAVKRAPILFWILDLWPESLSATGAVSSPFILGVVRSLVRFIYKRSDRILISSKGFASQVTSLGVSSEKIKYFPNWAEDVYWRKPIDSPGPILDDIPKGFRIVFAGNIGAAQSFETILGAAEMLREETDIQWLIMGDGRMAGWVSEEINARKLSHCVHMLGTQSPENVARVFAFSDALLVSLRPGPTYALTVPGKVQSYLACGKPIIASLNGEGARLIEDAGAGLSCPAGDAKALAEAVSALKGTPRVEREKMGMKGFEYCRENFQRTLLVGKLEGWFTEATQ